MNKKILAISLAAAMSVTAVGVMAGCNNGNKNDPAADITRAVAREPASGTRGAFDELVEGADGKTIDDALKLTNKAVAEALDGLPPVKMHCSVLAEEALRSAIADYYKRMGKDPAEILGCSMDCAACHHEHDEHAH